MKVAEACYEVIPTVVMTPFIFSLLRLSAVMPNSSSKGRFARITMLALVSYVGAVEARDAVYWPIVAQVYAETYRIDTKLAYKAQQAL